MDSTSCNVLWDTPTETHSPGQVHHRQSDHTTCGCEPLQAAMGHFWSPSCGPNKVWVGNCMSTCHVHVQKRSSKKLISVFPLHCRNTVYSVMDQKQFYSLAHSEQNIHETHKSLLNRNTTAKSPDKKGGNKRSTKSLFLISAIFRVSESSILQLFVIIS